MSKTALPTAQAIVATGLLVSMTAVDGTNGNSFGNNGKQFLLVKNADSGSHDIILDAFPTGDTPGGLSVTDRTISIAAGTEKLIGPFPPSIWNDASNKVGMTWSATPTAMTVAVVQFTPDSN